MMFRTCPSNPRFICRLVTEDKVQTEMKGQKLNFVSLERNVTLVRSESSPLSPACTFPLMKVIPAGSWGLLLLPVSWPP